jgi:hypothetical protein
MLDTSNEMPDMSIMQKLAMTFGEDIVLEMASSYIKSVMDRRAVSTPKIQIHTSELNYMESGLKIKPSGQLQPSTMPRALSSKYQATRYPSFM